MEPAPITTGLSAEAKQPMNASSNDQGSENDVLLGWARSKRNKLRGGSRVGKTANFTEGPLGGNSRSRVVSYDAATSMGLSRHDHPEEMMFLIVPQFIVCWRVGCFVNLWRLRIDPQLFNYV